MFTLAELLARKAAANDALEALTGERATKVKSLGDIDARMSAATEEKPEDQAAWDAVKAEIGSLDKKIERAVAGVKEIERSIEHAEAEVRRKGAAAKPVVEQAKIYPFAKTRYGKMVAFKGETAEEDAYRSGMFLKATMFRNEDAMAWCRENGVIIGKAQSEGVNTGGGFLVPGEFERAIIDLRETYGTFRQQCRVVPMGSDSMSVPRRSGGLTAYFVGENVALTESQKSWDNITLTAKKLAVLARMSTELAEDAIISIADDLAQEIAYAFAIKEDACGWNGDGTSTYGGIVGIRTKIINGNHTASAKDAATNHDTFEEIDATDLARVMAALPKYAEPNAKWYCSQPAWALVFQRLIAAGGGNTIDTLSGGKPRRMYLGYEVVIDQTLPTSTGDLSDVAMLFFGDLRLAARMGERRGIRVKTSDERYFDSDQIGIQGTQRFDINIHDLGDTSTAGPIIALIGD